MKLSRKETVIFGIIVLQSYRATVFLGRKIERNLDYPNELNCVTQEDELLS